MGGSNKKNKRKKSVNSPELNSEGTKQRTKQKKMADTPQPVKPVQQPVQQQQQYAQATLPPNALRRDCNGKCIELIEGHALEVVVEV